jgi:hypothetical protein
MSFRTIQVKQKTFDYIEICKDVFMSYHPEYDRYVLSNHKIINEALLYYIKTEKDFKHLIEVKSNDK